MRVLLLAPQPFYEERGTPIAVRFAAEGLAAQGHEVDLLTYHLGRDRPLPGVRHVRMAAPPGVRRVGIGFSLAKLWCDLWLTAAAARRMLRRRYDVVHAVEEAVFPALALARLGRARLVYDADSVMSEQIVEKWPRARFPARLLAWCEAQAFRRSDLVLAVCPAIAEAAARATGADGAAKIHLLPDIALEPVGAAAGGGGAGEAGAEAEAEVEDLRGGDARPLALYVGNLEGYQGVDRLLEAMALLEPEHRPHLVVIGGDADGVMRARARVAALGLGDAVRLTGARPLAALPAYLAQADILCSPRMKGRNTPMKIFSYMMAGRAILATAIESHSQVLDAGCAHLVPPSAAGLAGGLRRLTQDAALRRRLGTAARARAGAEYSHAAFLGRLQRAYATLLAPPPQAPRAAAARV